MPLPQSGKSLRIPLAAAIPPEERHKIDSAERFFKALQQEGVPVRFETKINRERLGDLISAIVNKQG